ncbi:nucleoside monophosphate kinase [Tenacibaculum halocynthiae]|uniref:nucleoside monophosphate kinase n=1 Tax=Tenacibaculum halocynthiae TaxID=1254437 RepID=UPI003D64D2EF
MHSDIYAEKDNFSELLSTKFELRIISVGDLIRTEYKSGSEIGIKIKEYIDNGTLIPTEFVNSILENEILIDNKDILIVNYPSTEELFHGFTSLVNHLEIIIDKIWHLKLTNLDYVTQKELINLGEIYTAKYEITNDTLKEKIKVKQENVNKIIELWKRDNRIITIDVDYENNSDMRTYFSGQIKSA